MGYKKRENVMSEMPSFKEALELANTKGHYESFRDEPLVTEAWQIICYDPAFFQALGKALGWPDGLRYSGEIVGNVAVSKPVWSNQWHRFIDHLIEGKDPDTFFKELIN